MNNIYLGLGSNIGDSLDTLKKAIISLSKAVDKIESSSVYKSSPMYLQKQADFYNLVVKGQTQLNPLELLAFTQSIESDYGRNRESEIKKGPRTLDIDILLYNDFFLDTPELKIPHPGILERAFVLKPLLELAPDLEHPIIRKKLKDFLEAVSTQGIYLHSTSPI